MKLLFKLIFIFLLCTLSATANDALKKVTLQLSWFDQFQFAGYYIAKEKGFYKDLGLDVKIIPFQFGLNIPEDISSGKIDFAIGKETLVLERAKNKKVVALYALFQASPLVLISTQESQINMIEDFVGKRVMTTINDASEVSIKAMVISHKIKFSDFRLLKHTHNINDLVDKKTDIISAYISKSPFELQKIGIPYTVFSPSDYGFDMYSDFLYTSDKLIAKDIKTVKSFKKASLKGWEYAYSHIEESADLIIKKYNTQHLSKEALVYEGEELKKLSFYKSSQLGKIQKEKVQRIYDLYNVMGLIENKIDVDDFIFEDSSLLTVDEEKYLKNKKELKICADPDWLPFEKIEDGKLIGISADYMKIIEAKIKIPIQLVPTVSWTQTLEYAKTRKCDVLSLALETQERKKYMTFTAAHISTPLVIATTTEKFFIDNLADITDKRLGIVKGYAFAELLKKKYPNINLIEVENIADGLKRVAHGKLYGFIDNLSAIGYEMQKNYIGSLKIAGKVGENWELGVGVRNDEPMLFTILNKVMQSIDEPTKNKILNKWVSVKYDRGFDYSLFWKLLGIMTIGFILLAVRFRAIQNYNRKINKNLEIIDKYVLLTYTDVKGIITYVSESLCKMTGYTKKELIGKPENIFRHPDTHQKIFKDLWDTIQSGKTWNGEIKNLKKDGTAYWVDAQIAPMFDKHGNIEGYSAFRYDITSKKLMEELSVTDQLTQVSNRLFLDNSYKREQERANRYEDIFSIILLDIDFFKDINDTFGHIMGDKVLIEMAKILKENIRITDNVGRWGGEEFLIICPKTDKNEAAYLAEKIRIKIENYDFSVTGKRTCSFGVAQYRRNDKEDDTMKRVDIALYEAKTGGRNRVVIDECSPFNVSKVE